LASGPLEVALQGSRYEDTGRARGKKRGVTLLTKGLIEVLARAKAWEFSRSWQGVGRNGAQAGVLAILTFQTRTEGEGMLTTNGLKGVA